MLHAESKSHAFYPPPPNMTFTLSTATPKSDNEILGCLGVLAKHLPVYSAETPPSLPPNITFILAAQYELAERTIRAARERLHTLEELGSDHQVFDQISKSLKELCQRFLAIPFPQNFLDNDGYFLQVFQNLTMALSQLRLPANAYWLATRYALLRLQYFNDFEAFLPALDAARQRVARNPGKTKFALDLAWTLDAALKGLRPIPAQRESVAEPLFFELEQTIALIPEARRTKAILERVEFHRQWLKAPPEEFKGWELLKEFRTIQESQEPNEGTVDLFIQKYDALGITGPSRLHSAFIRLLLSVRETAPQTFLSFFRKHGPDAFSQEDHQPTLYKGKTFAPPALRVARALAELFAAIPAKEAAWIIPFLEKGVAYSPELKLLRTLYHISTIQGDRPKSKEYATQLVRQDPNWFKHWEMLADAFDDNNKMKLACLSAALLCPVTESKYHARVVSKWLKSAKAATPAELDANLLNQIQAMRLSFSKSPSILSALSLLASPVKSSLFKDMDWIPAVIFSKGTRKTGVLEIAFVLNGQKQLARTRLEQHPATIQAKVGDPIAIRIQTGVGKPHVVDIATRPSGQPWDAVPPIMAEVLGAADIGNGLKVKTDKGFFVLTARRFPEVQQVPPGRRLELRLAINARTKLWEPVDAHFIPMPEGQTATLSMKGNIT